MQGETADRILETANNLLMERGYSAFSYADIADAVKIRKASIHHHFPTKAGLVVAVLRAHRGRIAEGMKALDAKFENPLQRIRSYFSFWESCIEGQTVPFCIGALLAAEMPSLPEEVQREVQAHFSILTDWFEASLKVGVKAGFIHLRGSVASEAQVLIASLHGAMLSARALGNPEVFRTITLATLKSISPARA